jgi:hypothetical protein
MDQAQAYLIPFSVPSEKERILDVIAHHNSESAYTDEYVRYGPEEEYELLRVGQPFTSAVVLDVKPGRAFASPHEGPALLKAVLVSQAGDRADTATFMRWHLMRAIPNVFCLGAHAVDCYACSKKLRKRYAEEPLERISKKRIGLSKQEANGQNGARIVPRVRPALWTTRFCATNPEWAAMLHGLDKVERRRRIAENPATVAHLTSYSTETKGFVVWDRHFGEGERESAESYAAIAGCA